MRIKHKQYECIGCALCTQEAPDYFVMDTDGMAELLDSNVQGVFHIAKGLEFDREALERAVEGCPVDIISLEG
ncbi:ferredoxin [Persicirhabdus sediminis]|uniref:Ferredoxin n=1 Tax=Persicirhabdus sediminis TaxID=454144 RepID=A0A8J7SKG1_9BACT|nr:ferredoxin [Persicirhabdus sediminis]MBK1789768.1 ferredoxin [Persicirhabdus sediminis]